MAFQLGDIAARGWRGFDMVIDVRAPAEFAEDHLPGAVSMPVLSDAERAEVGTIYTQDSPFAARKIGAAMVARNTAAHIERALMGMPGDWRPLVYCWRGGQRSGAFATILRQIGWRVELLEGGYRSYRRGVVGALYEGAWPWRLMRLDGNTGSAKTALLARAEALGVQCVDLEGLAGHRGSVLGAMAAGQPAQKGFESALLEAFAGCDPARPVLVEAESGRIGDIRLPPSLWQAMCAAPRLWVEAAPEARAAYLTRAYRDLWQAPERLSQQLDQLVPLVGRAQVEIWQAQLAAGAWEELALGLVQQHYDPAYARARAKDRAPIVARIEGGDLGEAALDRAALGVAGVLRSG